MWMSATDTRKDPVTTGREATVLPMVVTFVSVNEFDRLHALFESAENRRPRFGMIDLVSACVVLVHRSIDPRSTVILRARMDSARRLDGTRRRCELWDEQFQILAAIQRSPANRAPNPRFDLGDLTSACVGLQLDRPDGEVAILNACRDLLQRRTQRDAGDRPVTPGPAS